MSLEPHKHVTKNNVREISTYSVASMPLSDALSSVPLSGVVPLVQLISADAHTEDVSSGGCLIGADAHTEGVSSVARRILPWQATSTRPA